MIAIWMGYASLVGLLLTAIAGLVDAGARRTGRPRRWIWAGAMISSLALPLILYAVPGLGSMPVQADAARSAPSVPPGDSGSVWESAAVRDLAGDHLFRLSPIYADLAVGSWSLVSLLLLGRLLLAARRLGRARRAWPRVTIGGAEVLLSRDAGPAVVGLTRPDIVVPVWAVGLGEPAVGLLIEHERQHLAAGDRWLVLGAELLVVLVPWHPALWLQRRRLRRTIELDCDRRVLARGVSRLRYGRLLLDVGERAAHRSMPALVGFVGRRSELAERVEVLVERPPRLRRRDLAAGIGAGSLLVLAACLAPRPLPFETERVAADPIRPASEAGRLADPDSAFAIRLLIAEGLRRLGPGATTVRRLTIVRDRRDRIIEVFGEGPGSKPSAAMLAHLDPDAIAAVSVFKGGGHPDLVVIGLADEVPDSAGWRRSLQAPRPTTAIVLRILGPGQVTINDQPVAVADLEETLERIYDRRPRKVLFVRSDSTARDRDLAAIVEVARRVGVRVKLATPSSGRAARPRASVGSVEG